MKHVSSHVRQLLVDNAFRCIGAEIVLRSGQGWLKLFVVVSASVSADSVSTLRISADSRRPVIGRLLQMRLCTSAGSNVSIMLKAVAFWTKHRYT